LWAGVYPKPYASDPTHPESTDKWAILYIAQFMISLEYSL